MATAQEQVTAPELSRTQKRRRGALALIVAAGALLALVSHSLWPSGSAVHETVELAGLAFIVACILGRSWSTLYIGGRKKHVLITAGPYSLCRNPLYVFSVLGATGIGFTSGSLVLGLLIGGAIFLVFDRVVRREEIYLAEHHGEPFAAYCRRTPRWLPRFSAWQDAEVVEARPHLVVVTFREACLLLLAFPALEGIEWLQSAGVLPVLVHLP
jgi:protein-S-isoprenylcysteine O-methyltransferase Ste14